MNDIERSAERVLARVPTYVWDGLSLPVPVEDIADSVFGLLVRDAADLSVAPGAPALTGGASLSGLLLPAAREIWVNAEEGEQWPGRRRFTIGHEVGHWCLHRGDHARTILCRSTAVDPATEPPERPLAEREADAFAAALLMPAALMRREYAIDGSFERMCELFGASGSAMGKRMHAVI